MNHTRVQLLLKMLPALVPVALQVLAIDAAQDDPLKVTATVAHLLAGWRKSTNRTSIDVAEKLAIDAVEGHQLHFWVGGGKGAAESIRNQRSGAV